MIPIVASLSTTAVLCPIVIRGLRHKRVLDQPNLRSSHNVPTPRGLGIAPAIGATLGLILVRGGISLAVFLLLALVPIAFAGLGLADDFKHLTPTFRLVVQGGIALSAVPLLLSAEGQHVSWVPCLLVVTPIWLVGFVNAFNFMDGINGISGAQAVLAGSFFWIAGLHADILPLQVGGAVVVGAAAGFLPFNFPKAVAFLGDVGSYYFGAILAVLALIGVGRGLPPESMILPLALYVTDTAYTVGVRITRKESLYLPHRDHVYQRLVRLGWPQIKTTLFVAAAILLLSGLAYPVAFGSTIQRVLADTAAVLLLLAYLALPAILQRRTSRSSTSGAGGS